VRECQLKADQLDKEWNRLNDAFKVKFAADQASRRRLGRVPLTELEMIEIKGDNQAMNDAFSGQKWWAQEATRHMQDIQTFVLLRKEGLL
jgi:hypothetical protein